MQMELVTGTGARLFTPVDDVPSLGEFGYGLPVLVDGALRLVILPRRTAEELGGAGRSDADLKSFVRSSWPRIAPVAEKIARRRSAFPASPRTVYPYWVVGHNDLRA